MLEVNVVLKVLNQSNGTVLASKVKTAQTFFQRLKGLMFSKELPFGSALHILPCRSIHTFFMNYSIDVIYMDAQQRIVGLEERLDPGKVGTMFSQVRSVLELPAGTIETTGTKLGHYIQIQKQR
jgi:uncharacterized membrane protein (UPF0127 family)